MNTMSTLFPKIHFHPDETPMSWAARQAAFHTGGRVVPFLNDLKIPAADLVRGKKEAVERLCVIAGQEPAPVFVNTIMALGDRRYRLRGCEFSAEFTTGVVTRFCPLCLEHDRDGHALPKAAIRHRLHWRLTPVRTCRKHRMPLTDVRMGKWNDMFHEVQAIDDAVSTAYVSVHNLNLRDPSPLQNYVEGRLEGATGPDWLDNQAIDQACRTVEMLGGLMAFGPEQKAAKMTEDMWDTAGRFGWPLVNDGDAAIREFLRERLLSAVRKDGHPSPRTSYGMLYGWLFSSRLSKDPGPIKDIVRDVIVENVPLAPGQMLLGKQINSPRLACITSIASAECLHPKTLANILKLAGVIDDTQPMNGARSVVADYAFAKPFIERVKHTIPVTQVPAILSASRPMVAALIELGQLRRIQDHDELKSKVGKAIDGRSIRQVMNFIKEDIAVVDELPEEHVALAKAAEKTRVKLLLILELLFGGHLKAVCRQKGQAGFSGIMVSSSEIMERIKDPPDDVSDGLRFWMG